ncbi:MAG: discoidin domain-containing protein [bacterium]|nr:discoidin domain-containing protein [bacterium]
MNKSCLRTLLAGVLAGCILLGSGCGPNPNLYLHRGKKPTGAAISDPRTWKLSGNIQNIALAVDGNRSTAAVSALVNADTSITIDLQKACLFNAVFIHHGSMTDGYCGRVAVLTSLDGRTFTPQLEVPGTPEVTSLLIMKPVLARYVRLTPLRQGPRAWSVAEVYLQ